MNRLCLLFCVLVFLCVCGMTHLWQATSSVVEFVPKTQIHKQAYELQGYNYSGPKKNIVVLLAYYPDSWFEEKSVEERDMIMTNRKCYSAMHNYTFVVGSDIEVSHGYWAKLVHTHRLLNSPQTPQLDWVFFADADFFITNFDRPLESYIPTDDDYHIIVPQDAPGRRDFSNFNFLIKNSDVAMWRSILRLLDSYRGTDCEQAPDQCCRTICHGSQSECFKAHLDAMGCGPNQSCPPLHFSHASRGLGFATVVDSPWDITQLRQPLGIHCKPHYPTCRAYQSFFHRKPGGQCSIFSEAE
ncbi:uncharacterized protein ACA1_331750 [Acanthamoeba castellanii str. Neff]|uniref:Uncharacterized protein n=1 Tax=Acanthamoeba castellanii (strain ATCC 30010 / Neff) TaxID=1257118 RepID=L8HD17_ACACF|nr:uncharacterized protein ACA1_331750 [Acanthamoeba castellanii str. Neff]ELR22638.1 hypothetical protein ACA1_331750 [Acanthamoeba castellanii str. Neff]